MDVQYKGCSLFVFFFFQAEDGIRDYKVTGVQTCALPISALRLGDARGALVLANRRFDAIVSQPSHPWTAGASHLYTREFFALVHSRLTPEGVFVQWIGAAFADPQRLRSLLAAQTAVFANVQVYRPEGGAIVMVASDAP